MGAKDKTAKFVVNSGNPIVDEIGTMHFAGNIIPEAWYHTIVSDKGKVNLNAICLLAEICYWYRPKIESNEATGTVTYKKKFSDKDYLQKNYKQLCEKFGLSIKQCRDALIFLENLGVVKRVFRTVKTDSGPIPNVMYISLDPKVLRELTYPGLADDDNENTGDNAPFPVEKHVLPNEEGGVDKNVNIPLPAGKDMSPKKAAYPPKDGNTNTKTTAETTAESTTTENSTFVVADAAKLLDYLNLSDKDVQAIVDASGNDLGKIKTALNLLDQQTKARRNVTGWIISALRDGYKSVPYVSRKQVSQQAPRQARTVNMFNDFEQNTYDFDVLEAELLGSQPADDNVEQYA